MEPRPPPQPYKGLDLNRCLKGLAPSGPERRFVPPRWAKPSLHADVRWNTSNQRLVRKHTPSYSPLMHALIWLLLFATALPPFDLVIHNGHVIDGTGSPWYAADVGI